MPTWRGMCHTDREASRGWGDPRSIPSENRSPPACAIAAARDGEAADQRRARVQPLAQVVGLPQESEGALVSSCERKG